MWLVKIQEESKFYGLSNWVDISKIANMEEWGGGI